MKIKLLFVGVLLALLASTNTVLAVALSDLPGVGMTYSPQTGTLNVTPLPPAGTSIPGLLLRDVTGGALIQGGLGPVDTNLIAGRPNSARINDMMMVLDHLQGGVTPLQIQSGGADLAPSLNVAMTFGIVHLPCGTYQISTQVVITANGSGFEGENKSCVTIYENFNAGDVVVMGSYANPVTNPVVASLTMVAGNVRTSGAAIHETNSHFSDIHDIVIGGANYIGVQLDGGPAQYTAKLRNFEIAGASLAQVLVANGAGDVYLESGATSGGSNGILIQSVGGLYASNVDSIGSGNAIHLSPSVTTGPASFAGNVMTAGTPTSGSWKVGQYVTGAGLPVPVYIVNFNASSGGAGQYILSASVGSSPIASETVSALDTVSSLFFSNVLGDTSTGANWLFDGTGTIADINCSGCWGATSKTDVGFAFRNPLLSGASFTASIALNNFHHGWDIAQGKGISIGASAAEYNGQDGTSTYDGFNVGSAADHVTIALSRSGAFGQIGRIPGVTMTQRYGLYAGTGTGDARTIKVIGLDSYGNTAGTVQMPTGANIVNLGS